MVNIVHIIITFEISSVFTMYYTHACSHCESDRECQINLPQRYACTERLYGHTQYSTHVTQQTHNMSIDLQSHANEAKKYCEFEHLHCCLFTTCNLLVIKKADKQEFERIKAHFAKCWDPRKGNCGQLH